MLNDFIEEQRERAKAELRRQAIEQKRQQEEAGKKMPPIAAKPIVPIPVVKRTVVIDLNTAMSKSAGSDSGYIEDEAQVDACLAALREQLMAAVSAGDRVRIK